MDWKNVNNNTKEDVLRAVRQDGLLLEKFPQYQKDIEVVSAAVIQNGLAIQFADQEVRDSYENVVRLAIESNPLAIIYTPKFQSDYVIAKIAVRGNGLTLKYFQALADNREIVEIAVSNNGLALEFAPKFNNDREIVVKAIRNTGFALQYASKEYRRDVEFVLLAEKNDKRALSFATKEAQNTIAKFRKQIEKFRNGEIKLNDVSESLFGYQLLVGELKEACVDMLYNKFKDKIKGSPELKKDLDKQISLAVDKVHNRYVEHQRTTMFEEFMKTKKEISNASENL